MLHETITLPLRVGVRATPLGVRVTARAAGVALGITRRLEELATLALYEGVYRRRKTVLAQARRQLRSAYTSGSHSRAGRP